MGGRSPATGRAPLVFTELDQEDEHPATETIWFAFDRMTVARSLSGPSTNRSTPRSFPWKEGERRPASGGNCRRKDERYRPARADKRRRKCMFILFTLRAQTLAYERAESSWSAPAVLRFPPFEAEAGVDYGHRRIITRICELVDDRAVGPVVAVAVLDQML